MNPNSAKADALRTRRQLAGGSIKDRLLDLLRRADAGEVVDSAGRAWPDLTDFEAAAWLGREAGREPYLRTSVIPARNELVEAGLVEKARRRPCRFKPSGQDVWGWRLSPTGDAAAETGEPTPSPLRLVGAGEGGAAVSAGDTIRVPERVGLPCGRRVPKGRYLVLDVDARRRALVATPLDCSALPSRFHPPTPEERAAGAPIPFAAEVTKVWLEPGTYTAYAAGAKGPTYIHDR